VEKKRRERARVGGEIEGIKKRLKDTATAFAPGIAGLCDATVAAAAVVPEARELNSFLLSVATEVDIVIDPCCELQRQTEAVRAGHAALDLPQSAQGGARAAETMIAYFFFQHGYIATRRREKESAEDRLSTAA
jgi:hypothetical protein